MFLLKGMLKIKHFIKIVDLHKIYKNPMVSRKTALVTNVI